MSNYLNDKEKQVIEFHKEGKTIREIAAIVHMSFSRISSIIKKFEEEEIRISNQKNHIVSNETRAMQHFSEGKMPWEVKIALDISTEETEKYYIEWLKLKGLSQLYQYYVEMEDTLIPFLELYKKALSFGITEDEVLQTLKILRNLPWLKLTYKAEKSSLRKLIKRRELLESEIDNLEKSQNSAKFLLDGINNEVLRSSNLMKSKQDDLTDLETSLNDLMSSKDMLSIRNMIKQIVFKVLDNKKHIIIASLIAAVQAMKDDPQKGMLIWSLESKPLEKANVEYENPFSESYYQNFKQAAIYLDTNYELLLNLADLVYYRIVNFVHYYIFYGVKNRIQFE